MLYQLPSGRTVEMSVNQFLHLSDQDIQHLTAGLYGEEHNDPFYGSALYGLKHAFVDREHTLNNEDLVQFDELTDQDQFDLSSTGGLQSLNDDGDYYSGED